MKQDKKVSVLLVDDDPGKRLAIEASLNGMDIILVYASSGTEALRYLLRQDFAVILLDVDMPGMDGFETAQLIRQRLRSEHTPIIFISEVFTSEIYAYKGYSLGAVDYIYSPILPQFLRAKVEVFVCQFLMKNELKLQAERQIEINRQLEHEIEMHRQLSYDLRESEEKYRLLIENCGTAVALVNFDGIFLYANDIMTEYLIRKREEIIGKTCWDYFPETSATFIVGKIHNVILSMVVSREEIEIILDGRRRWFNATFIPIANYKGNAPVVQIALLDITEQVQVASEIARLDRLNTVGEMAASIGHEIRNPMTTVRGFLQMFKKKDVYAQHISHFDLMIEELDRVNSIITEFLTLAKNKKVNLQEKNICAIIETLLPLIQADAMMSDKYVHCEMGKVHNLLLDEKEIRQLILNLVRNGLEAMTPGGKLTLKTFTEGNEVILAVQDQGTGIEEGVLNKLGTPFFTTKEKGTGLGLAVCYSIASRHNATIKVETSSMGTTFLVKFRRTKEG